MALRDTLDKGRVNTTPNGQLVEVARGRPELERRVGEINQIVYHDFNVGKIGGNHFHNCKIEAFVVVFGEIEVHLDDMIGQTCREYMRLGDIFTLKPGIAHALYCPSIPSGVVEIANLTFNPDNPRNDVFPYKVI